MDRAVKAAVNEVSRQYVQQQIQHMGQPVRKTELKNAAKKVSKILAELEEAIAQRKR